MIFPIQLGNHSWFWISPFRVPIKNYGQEWPFFRSMLDLIDVELGKSSPMITEHYESKTVQQVAQPTQLGWLAGTAKTSKFSQDKEGAQY